MSGWTEPEFVRLYLPNLDLWVRSYRVNKHGLMVDTTEDRAEAGVFLSPRECDTDEISMRLSPVQVCDATFSEWVEAGGRINFEHNTEKKRA